jgi:hypothetical protein
MSTPQAGPGTADDVNDIIDLFCYALGGGAQMRIKRDAIRWFRTAFQPSIERMVEYPDWTDRWKSESVNVLDYVRTIGRLAANRAAESGMPHINLACIDHAVATVVTGTSQGDREGAPRTGNACALWYQRPLPLPPIT